MNAWQGFKEGRWTKEIDVRGFIQANYTPYEGDDYMFPLLLRDDASSTAYYH